MAGPGIKKDERIYGASLIDIAPTMLTLFDLPIGEDMDGRPLLEAFEVPPQVKTIRSWEKIAGESGMHPADKQMDRDQAQELMQQFAALGYIEDPGEDKEKAAESADIEAKYNIARTYLWKNQPDQALPLLEEFVRGRPWEDRFLLQLAACYFQSGYLRRPNVFCSRLADGMEPENCIGMLLLSREDQTSARRFRWRVEDLLAAEAMQSASCRGSTLRSAIPMRSLPMGQKPKAAYEKAIALDPRQCARVSGTFHCLSASRIEPGNGGCRSTSGQFASSPAASRILISA